MGVVRHRARHHLGSRRAGEPQELVDLMAGDVGENSAESIRVVEPVRAAGAAGQMFAVSLAVRTQPQGLHDLTDPSGAYQLARTGHATDLEALREGDRPEPTRLGHRVPDLVQLLECDTTRLVRNDVLAIAHRLDGDRCATVRDSRGDDQVDLVVVQELLRVLEPRRLRPPTPDLPGDGRIRVVGTDSDELAALVQQAGDLVVDMRVIQTDRCEADAHGDSLLIAGRSSQPARAL